MAGETVSSSNLDEQKPCVPQADRREPHPAELLEASARGFELDLRDAMDRFEDAARGEGLL